MAQYKRVNSVGQVSVIYTFRTLRCTFWTERTTSLQEWRKTIHKHGKGPSTPSFTHIYCQHLYQSYLATIHTFSHGIRFVIRANCYISHYVLDS